MTSSDAVLSIGVGCVLEVVAFASKHFYASKGYGGATDKEIPFWLGRLGFALGGALFIVVGVVHVWLGG